MKDDATPYEIYPYQILRVPLIGRLLGHRYVQVVTEGGWELRRVYRNELRDIDYIHRERTHARRSELVFGRWIVEDHRVPLSLVQHIWVTHSHHYI